jgi:hypothetical protein
MGSIRSGLKKLLRLELSVLATIHMHQPDPMKAPEVVRSKNCTADCSTLILVNGIIYLCSHSTFILFVEAPFQIISWMRVVVLRSVLSKIFGRLNATCTKCASYNSKLLPIAVALN